jgi:hypothetical protein
MRFHRSIVLLTALAGMATLTLSDAADKEAKPAFEFRQVSYFPRWSKMSSMSSRPINRRISIIGRT